MTHQIRKQEIKRASEYACLEYINSLTEDAKTCEGRPCDYNNYGNHMGFDSQGNAVRPYNTYEEGLCWYRATQPQLDDWVISQIVYENLKRTEHPDLERAVVKSNEYAGLSDEGIRLKKRRDKLQARLEQRKKAKEGLKVEKAPVDNPFILDFDGDFKKEIDAIYNFIEN